jgi:gliding motility-associated-like protein
MPFLLGAFFYFIINLNSLFSQNLVPNSSFEIYDTCPYIDIIENAPPWYTPTNTSSNLFNSCAQPNPPGYGVPYNWGYQYPRTGFGYSGIAVFSDYQKECDYISVKLDSTLVAGKTYCIGFYVSFAMRDSTPTYYGSMYAIDRMGAYLSDTTIHLDTNYIIPVVPQIENPTGYFLSDTLNWMIVSGTYVAYGGEQYITIGNFYAFDSTNYIQLSYSWSHISFYYIDDVFLYECNTPVYPAEAGNNITICKGDSVQIGTTPNAQYLYSWQTAAGLSDTAIANPWANPTVTTTYYLLQKDFKFDETIDSVTVTVINCDDTTKENSFTIPNAFTPNNDGVNDYFNVHGQNIKTINGKIFNRWGEELFDWNDLNSGWNGKYKGTDVSDGVYFYIIEITYNDGKTEEKHGSIELIRNPE